MMERITEASPRVKAGVFNRLLPQRIDNTYRGHKLALWLFAPLLLLKTIISLNSIFNGYMVATSADGIPLDTFPPGAAQTIVAQFAIWGLAHFMICLLGLLALIRYRAMIPFLFALLLLEHLSRKLILQFLPTVTTGSPPGIYVNLMLVALMIVGLGLSLWNSENLQAKEK